MGALWLPIEAYVGLSITDLLIPFWAFLLASVVIGTGLFFVDGHFATGFLKREIIISSNSFDPTVVVKFGDLFKQNGWKAVAVNNFFDSIVDDDLVSQSSLHGQVITEFWFGNSTKWQNQVNEDLKTLKFEEVGRLKSNTKKFPVGTTAKASSKEHNFLFVALSETNINNNVAYATAESLMRAVRGLLAKARSVCSNQPLNIPLMGSGLSRVGIKNAILVDLILTAIFEETKQSKVTSSIIIILPKEKRRDINLGAISRDWR